MVELKTGIYSGIMVMLVIIASGTTYYLEKTGDYKNCATGWVLQETGQYDCKDRGLIEWCYSVSDLNKAGIHYRCYLGRVIHQDPEDKDFADLYEDDEMIRHIGDNVYQVWRLQEVIDKNQINSDIAKINGEINELNKGVSEDELDKYKTYLEEQKVNDLMFWQEEKLQREELLSELK